MAQPIEVVSIFIAAGDRRDTRHHHFEHRVSDAVCIAAIRHRVRQPPAHTERALLFSQQQQAAIGGLVATVEINCEFLAAHRWKVEGKRRIVGHGGCGGRQMHIAIRRNTDLLRESRSSRYSRRKILTLVNFPGSMRRRSRQNQAWLVRTGLAGGSPQSHVFNMILKSTGRCRAPGSRFPPPRDKAA
jgi:hypothetical protein